MRFLANCLLRPQCHLSQIVVGTVVDIEVYVPLYTRQPAHVGMLPELPRPLVFERVHIVVGYPVRILVEDGVVQVAHLEFEISIDDGLYLIVLLHHIEPEVNRTLELLISLISGFMFHIEHWWQVAILQLYRLDEMRGLLGGRCVNTVEMVGTACKPIFTSLIEIIAVVLVCLS